MSGSGLIAALTTVSKREQAEALAHHLVEQGLAACVQLQAIESVYRWQGAVQQEPEWRLLIKSTQARWAELQAAVLAQHPYALPALVAWPLPEGNAPFQDWVRAETGS
ncbi:divalent-cation tolerance protein CutA [Inhella proteolytica]|uniref:Divalent-cation tolerance protein CutA n=1 Tax=Inhella proteolytica TaxID=2795029 RepID=A0A931J363_9BURK|nr:divalent-cation tolerance protein CutA [Inhella proteolytica]MBH9577330.1 divalent-cation tolerance protein CutA [Inhella proteolytica]